MTDVTIVMAGCAKTLVLADFDTLQATSMIGITLSAVIAALGYMLGEATSNPRLLAWAKSEVFDIAASGVILVVALAAIVGLSTLSINEVKAFGSNTLVAAGSGGSLYCDARSYLNDLGHTTYANLANVRTIIGNDEKEASKNQWKCQAFCLLGGTGTSISPNSGLYTEIGTLSTFMQGALLSHFAVLFMKYTLEYIYSGAGLFGLFLPLGIVLRTVPFLRGIGGALIALVLAMYVLYPFMLVVDSIIIQNVSGGYLGGIPAGASPYATNPIVYLEAIFLPAINFLVIIALTRTLSGALGDELDVSRLSQMV